MKSFVGSKKEVARLTGLTERTVHYYTDCGLVVPDIENPTGKGTTRKYSFENIVEFLLIKNLKMSGISLKVIKNIMDILRKSEGRRWFQRLDGSRFYLIVLDFNTENISTRLVTRESQEEVEESLLRLGYDRAEARKHAHKYANDIPISFRSRESALIFNLTKLAGQAANLV